MSAEGNVFIENEIGPNIDPCGLQTLAIEI